VSVDSCPLSVVKNNDEIRKKHKIQNLKQRTTNNIQIAMLNF
jgi:hypothetical protein